MLDKGSIHGASNTALVAQLQVEIQVRRTTRNKLMVIFSHILYGVQI